MEYQYYKQKYIEIAKSKKISLDLYLFNKYNNYKLKYVSLKNNMIGGKYRVGDKDSNNLLDANITVINAHGSINITNYYALPENVYLMITSDIGGITCSNYNNVFKKIINDNNSRDNLKTILESVSNYTLIGPDSKIIKNIYEGGNIIYEPGDLIPEINLGFHHSSFSNSAKLIYGIFNYNPIKNGDCTKTNILSEYDKLLKINADSTQDERLNTFTIGTNFNKKRLIRLIKNLKKRQINFEIAFTEFLVDDKYKKYIAQPNNLDFKNVRDNDDNIFLTMILTLIYRSDSDIDIYSQSIKDIINKLDKSKPNLIVLTSCLHTKNLFMRLFREKQHIPETLIEYNQMSGKTQKEGEYFKIHSLPQIYSLTEQENIYVKEFLEIYKDWSKNKDKITYILEEEIISINPMTCDVLIDCILNNNYQVINILRNNIKFTEYDLLRTVNKILISSDIVKTNDALIEFFKIKEFSNPEFKVDYKSLYNIFEDHNKKSLWDALIINKIKWYTYNGYMPESNMSILIKLINKDYSYDGNFTFEDKHERIKLIKLFFSNSTFNLLEYILTNSWSIDSDVIKNLKEFEHIIISNIDKNNIKELLIKISKCNSILNPIIDILYSNRLLHYIKPSEVSDLLIELINNEWNIDIDKLNNLIEKLKIIGVNINLPNQYGYNFYSYITEMHTCSMTRTRLYKVNVSENHIPQIDITLVQRESKQLEIIQKIETLGFTNNNRIIKDIPTDFTDLPWDLTIDNVKCKNYFG